MSGAPPSSGPGLGLVFARITDPSALSGAAFDEWYDTIHAPDVLVTGAASAAWRLRSLDPQASWPYVTIYKLEDFGKLAELATLRMTGDMLPDGKPASDFVEFDIRWYTPVQKFDRTGSETPGMGPQAIVAGLQPPANAADDLDAWYRKEHLDQMAQEKGFRRATRWKLAIRSDAYAKSELGPAPECLAIHEFDDNSLTPRMKPLDPMTDWTKKVMGEAEKIEVSNCGTHKLFGTAEKGL